MSRRIDVQTGAVTDNDLPPSPAPSEVRAEANRRIEAMVFAVSGVRYELSERQTWSEQTREALSYMKDANTPESQLPILSTLAAARGINISAMVQRVLANRAAFTTISAQILAKQTLLLAMNPIPNDFRNDEYWT